VNGLLVDRFLLFLAVMLSLFLGQLVLAVPSSWGLKVVAVLTVVGFSLLFTYFNSVLEQWENRVWEVGG
jgi:hypothetical protein